MDACSRRAKYVRTCLCRIFGIERIDAIEDAVQDALLTALKRWPYDGLPDNQTAWLIRVARNRMLDLIRSERRTTGLDDEEIDPANSTTPDQLLETEIAEDQLRMIFACCDPAISPDSRVALTLKIVGGFSVDEIANAYLASSAAVARQLTRAKERFRTGAAKLTIPAGAEVTERLAAVMRVLYLMFNEGYSAATGEDLIRRDLCFEAIRLATIVSQHPAAGSPQLHALLALFLFQATRFPARQDPHGGILLLADQDRTLWDDELIALALFHLRRSACGKRIVCLPYRSRDRLSLYHAREL